jgi:hypothetical protein
MPAEEEDSVVANTGATPDELSEVDASGGSTSGGEEVPVEE